MNTGEGAAMRLRWYHWLIAVLPWAAAAALTWL